MSIKRIFIVISAIFAVSAVFADNSSVTSKKYVDDLMSGYQGKLPGSGANTLMIYDETGIGEKSIEATLVSNATGVPTVGAVKTGLDGVQDTITGTAGYVMTGTGTPGEVGERAIYSANTNYSDSLVTAETVNSGVINAVNHSLRRVNANGELDNNGTLWEIADTVVALSYLPAGYTQLEYIESTGTQYINTGVTLGGGANYTNTDIKLEYDAVINKGTKWQVSGTVGDEGIFVGVDGSNKISYGGGNQISTGVTNPYVRCLWTNDAPSGRVTVKNTITGINIVDVTYTPVEKKSSINIFLFNYPMSNGLVSNNYMSGKMYGAKIYNNGALIRDMVPARLNSDNVVGMYDLTDPNPNTAFHTNAGNGEFIAGPPVGN